MPRPGQIFHRSTLHVTGFSYSVGIYEEVLKLITIKIREFPNYIILGIFICSSSNQRYCCICHTVVACYMQRCLAFLSVYFSKKKNEKSGYDVSTLSLASISTPRAMRATTVDVCPLLHARCRGVLSY